MSRTHLTEDKNGAGNPVRQGFAGYWRWWAIPAAIALILSLLFADPFIGDWDGLDYTVAALRGSPSSMALGRSVFIYFNHALWLLAHNLFGLRPENAYLLFKYAVVAESPLVVVACWVLARDVTGNIRAATIAALLVALSPPFIIYSGQVMTETQSLLILTIALIVHFRGLRERKAWMVILGAGVLGLGVNVRETIGFYGVWLVIGPIACGWKLRRREIMVTALACLIFFIFALGIFAALFYGDVYSFRASWFGWLEATRAESSAHPVMARNLIPFFAFFFLDAPLVFLALPFALVREWREHRFSPLFALASAGLFANALLFFNYSTTINWRYFLTGLPALAPIAADFLLKAFAARARTINQALAYVALLIISLAILFGLIFKPVSRKYRQERAETKSYIERLSMLPPDAVMISGSQTVAVTYWRGLGAGKWDTIGTGSGWPGARLSSVIEKFLGENRRVFLDADPRWWSPCGWQQSEERDLVSIESRFHFRRVSENIYEIRPIEDSTAQDVPDLQKLLPENRPEETERCALSGKFS
ncbi:MAG TPA: glycosyltransferase family 39 protein [Pyrinomonadaceae bacterium]|nr:glycosyltransferase family 39 protein [Pyrinomonadaceae bacterium]